MSPVNTDPSKADLSGMWFQVFHIMIGAQNPVAADQAWTEVMTSHNDDLVRFDREF